MKLQPMAILRQAGKFVLRPEDRRDVLHEWRRRARGTPDLPPRLERVLVLCKGNVCRSPYAEHCLASALPDAEIRSAGIDASGNDPANPDAIRLAGKRGVDLRQHRTRRLVFEDVAWAQLVLGMQGHHVTAVGGRWPEARSKIRLLGDFLEAPPFVIVDPWGCEDAIFERVFDQIEAAARALAQLRNRG